MILITEIRPYKRTKLFEVFSENGPEFLANQKFLTEHQLLPRAEYDDDDFEQIKARAQLLDAIRKCVDILSRKDYSKKELLQKLSAKGIPEDAATAALSYMETHGYQDDVRYAKRLAELGKNSYGRKRVEQILYQHGIERETAKDVLDEVFSDPEEEDEQLDRILDRAAKGKDLASPQERNKLYAKLARLGYAPSAISGALSRYRAGKDENL